MQGMKQWMILLTTLLISIAAFSQTDYIPLWDKQNQVLDRLGIQLRNDSVLEFSSVRPYNRQKVTQRVLYIDSLDKAGALPFKLSQLDRYNIQRLLMDNEDFAPAYFDSFRIKKPVFNTFYKNPGSLFAVNTPDFKLVANPLLNLQYGHTNDGTGNLFVNSRGIYLRGNIANMVGFYTYLTENQERDPRYVRQFFVAHNAVPGEGYYKTYGKNLQGFDYFDARGGITFHASKYFDFVFAYDKLFVGNGYRSMFLSDFSNSFLHFKVNARFWKFNYQSVFAELTSAFKSGPDSIRPKKYMALHHITFQAFKWLNLGLYENIMFNRSNGYELNYLNPVIFYKAIEQGMGSPDKVSTGLEATSNITRNIQLYGQFLINEFQGSTFFQLGAGSWRNKRAIQIGGKYINAFGINNLDLQLEGNFVRPYTYAHYDSIGNFSHYNQPLAHPLGANFRELVALAKYQPFKKLWLQGKLIAFKQGLDSAGKNFGSNIFLNYYTHAVTDDVKIGVGLPVTSVTLGFNASYEIFENTYIDFNGTYRTYNIQGRPNSNALFYTFGFRMNMARREFNF
ncbi:hypothetical protein DXN05_18575 [Deminuibacter soli]|uniref:Capsule assembly Wzi family protein n=2 Tax=Deminuibacter soli TaxID=2291815 RepID=A0A3E1NFD3_9BACT|nr:hypothetical protein DXN05_18575 [Deminuibacter soli]